MSLHVQNFALFGATALVLSNPSGDRLVATWNILREVKMYRNDIRVLTHSEMRTWKQCRAKHNFQYTLKLRSTEGEASYFRRGGTVHRFIELMYLKVKTGEWTIERFVKELENHWAVVSREVKLVAPEDLQKEFAVIKGMVLAYHKHYFLTEQFEGVVTEKELFHEVDGACFAGKIDAIVKKEGKYYVHDYKCVSNFTATDRLLLNVDEQFTLYILLAQLSFGKEFAGGIRTAIESPNIKQGKKETVAEYCDRVVADYLDRPEFYLSRVISPRSQEQVQQYRIDVVGLYNEIVNSTAIHRSPSTMTCGMCDFLEVCTEVDAEVRRLLVNSKFTVGRKTHQELTLFV
jgi:hypothetical protein